MKTILFDFGNVIAFFDHQRAIARLARYTDMPPFELTLALYGGTIENDYEMGRLPTAEYFRLAKLNGRLTCSEAEFVDAFVDIFWRNDEVCDLIPKLKPRYRLVLASNTNDAHFRKYCDQFADVIRHFDHLCPSHVIGERKPHPEYFAGCQRFVDARPEECLFVDDLAVNIEAATKHGWAGVCYRADGTLAEKLRAAGVLIG
ncbi:HAD-IA family hydrolase [Fimbriiglobus ruber]|uniref:HAD-superfamily hydrolase, subfamily IA, variant 3 n=1 Tax=Fimbriiglobus ruber TaxID=1908690 RepID=A0A225DC79_9BACT|nr:HAD-IA family hydrolase [Fimbriiglobus ruber]OWK36138.1 HAD-superfamily hydrolase, subfamily IA, variant 3 [Fimbriiglobus ruber]